MVTDDERRSVAEMLRGLNFSMSYRSKRDMWDGLRRVVGEYDDRPFGGVYTFARLADLIEPDHVGDSNKMVDRDALLALASGLEADADRILRAARNARFGGGPRMGEAKHDAYEWRSIARRIREALGVNDG